MIKKYIKLIWDNRAQFKRYFLSGITSFVIDMATLYTFAQILNFSPVMSVILNQLIVIIFLFSLNKFFAFKSEGKTGNEFGRFIAVMGLNYVIAVAWMWFWNEQLGFNYMAVRIVNIVLSVSWNFLLYKFWVYKKT